MTEIWPYAGRIFTRSGAVVTCIARGSSALAALHNLRRAYGDGWKRMEVGLNRGDRFEILCAEER